MLNIWHFDFDESSSTTTTMCVYLGLLGRSTGLFQELHISNFSIVAVYFW